VLRHSSFLPAESERPEHDSSRTSDRLFPQREPQIHAAWLIVPCLACDFLMAPVFSSLGSPPSAVGVAIALGIVGCVLAQGNLLAAWLAWDDGPFLRRLLAHWMVAMGLYLIWLVGFGLAVRDLKGMPEFARTVVLGVPLVSLAAQFPLWIARQWFGWRLVRDVEDSAQPIEPPLKIRDLMVATLVVAASLALARLAPADGKNVWPIWTAACTVASFISSIALLPAGALLLRMQPFGRGLTWSVLYASAWIALEWILVAILRYYGAGLPPRPLLVALSSLMFTFAATLILTATIARGRGYRLTNAPRRVAKPRR